MLALLTHYGGRFFGFVKRIRVKIWGRFQMTVEVGDPPEDKEKAST